MSQDKKNKLIAITLSTFLLFLFGEVTLQPIQVVLNFYWSLLVPGDSVPNLALLPVMAAVVWFTGLLAIAL